MMKKEKRKIILLLIITVISLFYLWHNTTYTSYESEVETNVESNIADWKILINGNLLDGTNETGIDIDNIQWTSEHTREGKIAPGATGIIPITIDPTTTNVSFDYELTILDHTVDENKLLTVTEIENTNGTLEKIDATYKGTMLLQDIKEGKTEEIKVHVKWEDYGLDTVVVPEEQENETDFIEIEFKATQRK